MRYQLLAAIGVAFVASSAGCGNSKKTPEVASVGQDTMLLRDLAEANKNTAAAAAVDNSLNTVNTTGGGAAPGLANVSSQPRTVVQPSGTLVQPSGTGGLVLASPRPAPPRRASDGSGPTTVPTELSPASRSSGDPCDSPAAVDQRSCLNRSIAQNDAGLNRAYQELIAQSRKSGGPELEQRFRQAQRDWVNQRDAECRDAGDGALWARTRARCHASRSESRTAELKRNLNSLRGQ